MSAGRLLTIGLGTPFSAVKYLVTLGLGTSSTPPGPDVTLWGRRRRQLEADLAADDEDVLVIVRGIAPLIFEKMRGKT